MTIGGKRLFVLDLDVATLDMIEVEYHVALFNDLQTFQYCAESGQVNFRAFVDLKVDAEILLFAAFSYFYNHIAYKFLLKHLLIIIFFNSLISYNLGNQKSISINQFIFNPFLSKKFKNRHFNSFLTK